MGYRPPCDTVQGQILCAAQIIGCADMPRREDMPLLLLPLYKAIVRPYCKHTWRPYLRKDINMLEKVQRRAAKLIPGLRELSYEEILKECGLTTLETRRLRGDQI